MSDLPTITDADVKRIAASADADERSVLRRLLNLPVRGRAGVRIDVAISTVRTRTPRKAAKAKP